MQASNIKSNLIKFCRAVVFLCLATLPALSAEVDFTNGYSKKKVQLAKHEEVLLVRILVNKSCHALPPEFEVLKADQMECSLESILRLNEFDSLKTAVYLIEIKSKALGNKGQCLIQLTDKLSSSTAQIEVSF